MNTIERSTDVNEEMSTLYRLWLCTQAEGHNNLIIKRWKIWYVILKKH